MNEKLIERKLRDAVKAAGGIAVKLFSPYFTGLPDRMILMPGGRIVFAEIKTTGKKPTKRQAQVHAELERLGFPVWVVDSENALLKAIKEIKC